MFRKMAFISSVVLLAVLMITVAVSGCGEKTPIGPTGQTPQGDKVAPPSGGQSAPSGSTAVMGESGVASDLSNITNKDMFTLSDAAKDLLVKNGFVVVGPAGASYWHKEFFTLYEENRYRPIAQFVTTDSLLHTYHLFFDFLLRTVETESLAPELRTLNSAMLAESLRQYFALKGTAWENAARRNVGFFAVGSKLMDPAVAVPPEVETEVKKELDLIAKHEGVAVSPLMNIGGDSNVLDALKEDYSQYIPRGHYDKSDLLQAYFRSMMWYGRLTFRFKSEDETRSAALITLALNQDANAAAWGRIYEPTSYFVGVSDDVTYLQLKDALAGIYGAGADLQSVVSDAAKWPVFVEAVSKLDPPAINSMPIFDETIQPDREKEIKGFRFMGQRFSLDASIFQRLVYREVKENDQGQRRMLPKGLDIPAALGSKEAYDILQSMDETGYKLYPENMAKMREYVAGLSPKDWTQNLYWNWLYTLLPLTQPKEGDPYPAFMRSQAWARKELNTLLGSWTELKHDTILYVKQMYAEAGGGEEKVDDRGYVEPNPLVFERLAALAKATREGLGAKGLLSDRDKTSLERLEKLSSSLQAIAEKELANRLVTDEDYGLIRSYGAQLEHFWIEAVRDVGFQLHRSQADSQPAALVADVATDPNGLVLEEAIGHIDEIYAAVPVDGKLRIVKGGVYSYYEFTWPMQDRLTDVKWRQMLDEQKAPPRPEWTKAFLVQ